MRVIIKNDYDKLSHWIAYYIMMKINNNNNNQYNKKLVLGLPTGSSPLKVYEKLIEYYKNGEVSFKNVITFNMDEYVGLPKQHMQSYYYFMHKNFFDHIDILPENINMLDGCASNLKLECERYEKKIIEVGGIDLFLGGVGTDGHIAFNEPGSSLASRTRIKTLCEETIKSNSRFFDNINVPRFALTVGLGTIMDSSEVLIIISGFHKAHALKECLEGNVNNTWTITLLQHHKQCIIGCDKEATRELKVKTVDYFKNLQKITNILGEPNYNYIDKFINPNDKIVIFSPHPDDDVIGLGGTLQKFNKQNVTVVYMTNGSHGYDKSKYSHNPRIIEAILSLKVLGYKKSNTKFLELPFYKEKTVTSKDFDIISDLLEELKPNHIFVCNDTDPSKTHNKCYSIIKNSKFNKNLKYIWLYNSAWGNWNSMNLSNKNSNINCRCYFDQECFDKKKLSIMMHDSQDPPLVYYDDDRAFYDKIENESKLNPGYYEENFCVLSKQEFLKI
jgi:glucosamine-6-phosphate deaminase